MRNLIRLAKVVTQVKLMSRDFITIDKKPTTKLGEFYNNISNGKISSDVDAAEYFYQDSPSNPSYKNLKSTLKIRLINMLFFWNAYHKYSDREKELLYCTKYMAASELLIYLNVRGIGIEVCHKVLKKGMFFGFPDIVIRALTLLRAHYSLREGDRNNFNKYNELLNHYIALRTAELKANECYLKLMIPYVKNKEKKSETYKDATEYFNLLNPYLEEFDSPYLQYIIRYIESLAYLTINDYEKTKTLCVEAIKHFESKPYVYKTGIKAFMHQQVLCCIQLRLFEEGEKVINRSAEILREGTYNWYINLDLYITLALHSKQYQTAYVIYNKAINHKKIKHRNDNIKERWKIYEIYLHFLVYIEKIKVHFGDNRFNQIKMGRFINSVPMFSKDKRGMNIPILISQILFMIVKKDYEKAIDRIESIEKYCTRYLRKDSNFRSNCFIKMLLQIPKAYFHRSAIERKTANLYKRLKAHSLEVANQPHEIEIIPYEDLWEFILQFLDTKIYKQR